MSEARPEEKKPLVWIACRATENCPGMQAEITRIRSHAEGLKVGEFEPTMGGKTTHYRCSTCHRDFHIAT